MQQNLIPLIVPLTIVFCGCSEVGPPTPKGDLADMDQATYDMNVEPPCTPLSSSEVCIASSCGMQSDGCGGVVECEPCRCENSAPVTPNCGPCNLGTPSCDERGNLTCLLPPIPNIETLDCEVDLVYVQDNSEGGLERGTREAPFKSLKDATTAANANGSRAIVIRGEGMYEEGPYVIEGSVSLVGGYGEDWRYEPSIRPTLSNQIEEDQDSIAIEVRNVTSPAVFANIIIRSKDAPPSRTSYALIADTANRLVIVDTDIFAGRGGIPDPVPPQTEGRALNGLPGPSGKAGQKLESGGSYTCAPPGQFGTLVDPNAPLPCEDPLTKGGEGGAGGCETTMATPGENSAQGAKGGVSGNGLDQTPQDGEDGRNTAGDGAYGQGGIRGFVSGNRWLTIGYGEDGEPGQPGVGGGGGGGAAMTSSEPYLNGPSGGTGGAGGCGGAAGLGGGPGGSSFGLFVVNTIGLQVINSHIQSADAGSGASGSNGGFGGLGAKGGSGSSRACEVKSGPFGTDDERNCTELPFKSGDGGDGANGLDGGPGGGGAGGDSVGIFCHMSNIAIAASVSITNGSAGSGADGGTYPGGNSLPEGRGEQGIAANTIECD